MKTIIWDQPKRVGKWVCERTGGVFSKELCVAIGVQENEKLIAGFLYDQFRHSSIGMHLAIEKGALFGRDILNICFGYPFNQLKVKKLIGMIDGTNAQCLDFCKRVGGVIEATIKDGSKNGDLVIYSMTRDQCKFLRKNNNEQA